MFFFFFSVLLSFWVIFDVYILLEYFSGSKNDFEEKKIPYEFHYIWAFRRAFPSCNRRKSCSFFRSFVCSFVGCDLERKTMRVSCNRIKFQEVILRCLSTNIKRIVWNVQNTPHKKIVIKFPNEIFSKVSRDRRQWYLFLCFLFVVFEISISFV